MCGIIGTTKKISLEDFKKVHKFIFHRGPDSQAVADGEDFIFGHARLSIIDLDERANQPFVYQNGTQKLTVVFNGEIYNYQELKDQLITKGYQFFTTSDTEVLCSAFLEWGTDSFDYFQGMWAVAIYNHIDSSLILARDRVGKKPLYYTFEEGHISFGSSLWGVAALTDKKKISKEGLQLYFSLGFTPDKYTIVEGVDKLTPGAVHVYKKVESSFELIKEEKSKFKSFKSLEKSSIKDLITKSVKKRVLSSDVPIATLMSGGVDSTIVSRITKEIHSGVSTFFVDFEDKKLSEKYWAQYLAKKNGIHLQEVFLSNSDLVSSFSEYVKVYEEPFADYSGIPSIAIFKKVAEKFKVVLTGDGGDELFFGYPHYKKKLLLYYLLRINSLIRISKFFNPTVKSILDGGMNNFESNYLKNHAIVTPFASRFINEKFISFLNRNKSFLKGIIQYDREFNNLPEKYLVKTDRASMYSGIEVRSPFLDEELLAKNVQMSIWRLFNPFVSKIYLKIAYLDFFGLKYFSAKKQGFTPPIQELRDKYFKLNTFVELKQKLKKIDSEFYKEIENLEYEDLVKDKILFDRFFFFSIWFQEYEKNINY